MPRELTDKHKRAMARGRERSLARRERGHRLAILQYEDYVKRDAELFHQVLQFREMFGRKSKEAREAEAVWRENMATCPPLSKLPDDKTWRRLTGRVDCSDER